jgi:L-ascorbate metabolism protein UlaG (beta-lactamase superfamily)
MKDMHVTYKNLRLFVREENEGWLAYVYDLDQIRFLHEGELCHPTIEAAQKEAKSQADLILGETTDIDWSNHSPMHAHG